jgi:hypothetical protein
MEEPETEKSRNSRCSLLHGVQVYDLAGAIRYPLGQVHSRGQQFVGCYKSPDDRKHGLRFRPCNGEHTILLGTLLNVRGKMTCSRWYTMPLALRKPGT